MTESTESSLVRTIDAIRSLGVGIVLLAIALLLCVLGVSTDFSAWGMSASIDGGWQRAVLLLVAASLAVVGVIVMIRDHKSEKSNAKSDVAVPDVKEQNVSTGFFKTLDEVESFSAAFKDCTQIDILIRTGANVLHRYQKAIIDATKADTLVRIVVLNPAAPAAVGVYGPGSDDYLRNASAIPDAIRKLEKGCKRSKLQVKKTRYLPPFSMFIVYKRDERQTYARTQINFTHAATGGDRPTFAVESHDRWFPTFQQEFRDAWRASKKTSADDFQRIVDTVLNDVKYETTVPRVYDANDEFAGDCPFDGDAVDRVKFFETTSTVALPNHAPIVEGHALVVPRRHVQRLADLTTSELADLFESCRFISSTLMRYFGATGVNWAVQDGRSGGQTVDHVHVHIIPRMDGDLPTAGEWYGHLPHGQSVAEAVDEPNRRRLTSQEMANEARRFRGALAAGETSELRAIRDEP